MAIRLKFENNIDIGVFIKLTNAYCLVSSSGSDGFYESLNRELGDSVPIIKCTISGTKIVGRLTAGNKNGLLVPESTSEEEVKHLLEKLP